MKWQYINSTKYYRCIINTMAVLRWLAESMRVWDGGLRAEIAKSKL